MHYIIIITVLFSLMIGLVIWSITSNHSTDITNNKNNEEIIKNNESIDNVNIYNNTQEENKDHIMDIKLHVTNLFKTIKTKVNELILTNAEYNIFAFGSYSDTLPYDCNLSITNT